MNTSAYLGVGFNVDGDPYTTAPPPVTSSNDSSIATTKWVNDKLADSSITGEAKLVETWHDGASWYRIWSDGFIEQGGQFEYDTKLKTYHKAYTSTPNVQISMTLTTWGLNDDGGLFFQSGPDKNGFSVRGNGDALAGTVYWTARGY